MYQIIRRVLFYFDPESVHVATHRCLMILQRIPFFRNILCRYFSYSSSRLEQQIWGLKFANPIGLAAGFDKNGTIADGMACFGFGFLELGSVTFSENGGNLKPRLFRLDNDNALINRMGLNNGGAYSFLNNFLRAKTQVPKLVNISKTNDPSLSGDAAIEDVASCYRVLGNSVPIVVFNLSCPNTKDGKTFEDPESLQPFLKKMFEVKAEEGFVHDVLVKFSSDIELDALATSVEISLDAGVTGFVLCNTSNQRSNLKTDSSELEVIGKGGLSGEPIFEQSLERVAKVFEVSKGKVPIVGLGGICTSEQAIAMIEAGASLLEIYTGLVYEGPSLPSKIAHGIDASMSRRDMLSISEMLGLGHPKIEKKVGQ